MMSSNPNRQQRLPIFLPAQQLSQLNITDPKKLSAFLKGDRSQSTPEAPDRKEQPQGGLWRLRTRELIGRVASGARAPWRVLLMCDAGLGKTTNMHWLQKEIAAQTRGRQIPFLFRLDWKMELKPLRRGLEDPDALLEWMAVQLKTANEGSRFGMETYLRLLHRLRREGRLTLLIDGLDHVMSDDEILEQIAGLMHQPYWESCPIWISGRPEAFRKEWVDRAGDCRWQVLRVEAFSAKQSRDFLRMETGHEWYDVFPAESRTLLAIPRFLRLIASVIERALPQPPAGLREQKEAIEKLELDTPAGVYHRAYFEIDDIRKGKVDAHGLLAQGLQNSELANVGLDAGRSPSEGNLRERVDRLGLELGATAFYMMSRGTDRENPQPNWLGATESELIREVGRKLERLGVRTAADYERDLTGLRQMNNLSLDFLLFNNDQASEHLVFHDRTVQAFFASSWAVKYGTDDNLKLISRWIGVVRGYDHHYPAFDEFWQFAAQMPNRALRRPTQNDTEDSHKRWLSLFSPCYLPPAEIWDRYQGLNVGAYAWTQWHHSMVYHSIKLMKGRDPDTIDRWRSLWLTLEHGGGTTGERRIYRRIIDGFRRCPKDPARTGRQEFEMGSLETELNRETDEVLHPEIVDTFSMHESPVTNEQFELYDPEHNQLRHKYSSTGKQPVIQVSFWEAACFALWTGKRLPTEVEWEYSCRAGTTTAYWFGDNPDDLGNYAWFRSNSGSKTHSVGRKEPNAWGLFDMHGNIWEWCDSFYEAGGSNRVNRGGSWLDPAVSCRSACRSRDSPVTCNIFVGFRLSAGRSRNE